MAGYAEVIQFCPWRRRSAGRFGELENRRDYLGGNAAGLPARAVNSKKSGSGRVDFLARSIRPAAAVSERAAVFARNLHGNSRALPIPAQNRRWITDPATRNTPPGLSPMTGSALGAQIRREVFGERENVQRSSPKTSYFGDPFRP
jgi:hypothetical protein